MSRVFPLYVRRDVSPESAEKLKAWAKAQGITTMLAEDTLHLTVAYSKKPVDLDSLEPDDKGLLLSFAKPDFLGHDGERVLVLLTKPYDYLEERWAYYKAKGAHWKYDGYKPHITLSWSDETELKSVPDFQIELGPEIIEKLDIGWQSDDMEIKLENRKTHGAYQAQTHIPKSNTSMEAGDKAYATLKTRAPAIYQYLKYDAPVPIDPVMVIQAMLSRMPEGQVLQMIKGQLEGDAKKVYGKDFPVGEPAKVREALKPSKRRKS